MTFLKKIRQLDQGHRSMPAAASPSANQAMKPPYWDEATCLQDADGNLNPRATAGLYAAAWCLTGGRQQHGKAKAVLIAATDEDAAERLLAGARSTVGQPLHSVAVTRLIAGLEAGLKAQLNQGVVDAA